jgi:tRNA(fMet)-specific endonuclease VapC
LAVTRYLLDTNHAGTLLDAHAPLWSRMRAVNRRQLGLCRPSVGELYFMIFNSAQARSNRTRLEALLRQFEIWELDAKATIEFGRLRAQLRAAGRPIPIFDVLIAAIARSNHLVLLTADRHFNSVDGLAVENWLA